MGDEKYVYVTVFRKKKTVVKNNVKNRMIQNLISSLLEVINANSNSVLPAEGIHSQITLPQYDKGGVDPFTKVSENEMPCLEIDCEWMEYQDIVVNKPSRTMWRLPAVTPDGKCILCDKNDKKELDVSKIRISAPTKIVLLP
jgi:hypothetical protein